MGHSEPRKRAKNLVTFLKKAKPLKECFKILRGCRPAQDDPKKVCVQSYKQPLPALPIKKKLHFSSHPERGAKPRVEVLRR